MAYALAILCIVIMVVSLLLIFLGLPGTWVIIGVIGVWAFFVHSSFFGWQFFLLLTALAVAGEIAEFLAGHYGAKKFGGTTQGSYGGIAGALVGGIVCAPLFFGLGALPGALAGAFIGCFFVEKARGMEAAGAAKAALGTTLGRFGGFVVKLSIGIGIIWMAVPRIWSSI